MNLIDENLKNKCLTFLENDKEINTFIKKEKAKLFLQFTNWKWKNLNFFEASYISVCILAGLFCFTFLSGFMKLMFILSFLFLANILFLIFLGFYKCYSDSIKRTIKRKVKNTLISFIVNNKDTNYFNAPEIIAELHDYENNINFSTVNDDNINLFKDVELSFLEYCDNKIENKKIIIDDSINRKSKELKNKYLLENNKG